MMLVKAIARDGRELARWDPARHPRDAHGRFIEVGHKVWLPDGTAATVVRAISASKVEVRRADGRVQSVAANTVSSGTRPAAAAQEHRPEVTQVRARDLKPGDHAVIPHPVTGKPGAARILGTESRGDSTELDIRHGDGTESYYLTDRGELLGRVDPGKFPDETATTPDLLKLPPVSVKPLPDGTTVARPVLYTYQRQKITALNLDRDRALPADVIQAASRIRQRQPLSAGQSVALSAVLRDRAAALKQPQRRALERTAWRLDAAAAEAHGHIMPPPAGIVPRHATPVTPGAITEGDHIVLADAAGKLAAAKIRGITPLMGGRLALVDLEHDDGTTETRTVTGKTRMWLVPDRPDDIPVPPPGPGLEHITPDRLRPGDTIRVAAWQGDASRTAQVTAVTAEGANGVKATLPDGSAFTYTSEDGGPSIIRTARGPASEGQPWDSPLPDGPPVTIPVQQVKVGDRIHVDPGTETSYVGTVQSVSHSRGMSEMNVRSDDSETRPLEFEHAATVVRLAEGDANAEARIAEAKKAREEAQAAKQVSDTIGSILADMAGRDVNAASHAIGSPQIDLEQIIRGRSPEDLFSPSSPHAEYLGRLLYPGSSPDAAAARKETAGRLLPLIAELHNRNRDAFIGSLRNAVAGISPADLDDPHYTGNPAGPVMTARRRVIQQMNATPPPPPSQQVGRLLAGSVAALRDAQGKETPASSGGIPELPAGTDLATRIRAYRAALPADSGSIGKAAVTRAMITAPRLEDLEAGRAPAIEQVSVAIPDRAPDGGPGAMAMRHLDTVMAAGRDLDAEIQARMQAAGVVLEPPGQRRAREARLKELAGNAMSLTSRSRDAHRDASDEFARANGYKNLLALHSAHGRARYGRDSDPAEIRRLRDLADEAEHAGAVAARPINEELTRNREESKALRAQGKASDLVAANGLRTAALGVMREIRQDGLGGQGAKYIDTARGHKPLTEKSKLVQAMRWAEQHYPAGWLAKYREAYPNGYQLGSTTRGFHRPGEIRLSKDGTAKVTGSGESGRVAIHEQGHAMERAVPGLRALEDAYLWSRTSSGKIGSRTREARKGLGAGMGMEYSYHDEFPEPYSGKDYPRGGETSDAYELFTTGVESLFAGSTYLDPSFRQWLLGTLALVD